MENMNLMKFDENDENAEHEQDKKKTQRIIMIMPKMFFLITDDSYEPADNERDDFYKMMDMSNIKNIMNMITMMK